MSSVHHPPETYQQWLDCFQHLSAHPFDRDALALVVRGTVYGAPSPMMLERLSVTVGQMLQGCFRTFLRQIDQCLADGEPDLAPFLAARLKRNVRGCMFYRSLPFLEQTYVQQLDQGYEDQIRAFWQDFVRQLKRTAAGSMSPELEDMAYALARMHITAERYQ